MAKNESGRRTKGLTVQEIERLKPIAGKRVELSDFEKGGEKGLFIRANANGTRSWSLLYRRKEGGKLCRWTIGDYPDVGLAEARELAAKGRVDAKHGRDPRDAKREDRAALTFGDLVSAYLKRAKLPLPIGKESWPEDERVLNKLFLPAWKNRAVKSIKRADVREIIEEIAPRAPVAANRALACISGVFKFAIKRDWLEANPVSGIDRQPEESRTRVLSDDEIRELLAALADIRTLKRVDAPDDDDDGPAVSPMVARGLEAILRTAQRPGEVFGMRWSEIDRDAAVWTVPAARTKSRRLKSRADHRVPLTAKMIELLDEATAAAGPDQRYVFAGAARGSSVKDRAKKAMSALRRAKAITFDAHRHDFRRTAGTLMEADHVKPVVIAKLLNHAVPQVGRVTSVYTRHPYDDEKRAALETLERRIDAIVAAVDAKVLPFAR